MIKKIKSKIPYLIAIFLMPTIALITGYMHFSNENNYILRITFFCAFVGVMIELFIILIFVLKEMAEEEAERTAESIRRIIKG